MPIHLPPDVDRAWLEPLTDLVRYRGEWVPQYQVDGAFRVEITRQSPTMFALVYLSRHLRSRETGGRTSLARAHLDIAARIRRWKLPGAHRDAVILARGGAKSTWALVDGPLWVLAHEWRRFVLGFSDSADQIRLHIGTARAELAENVWLRQDYPHLQPWSGARGRQDNALTYVTRSGQALVGRSTHARTLGIKVGDSRPDVLVLDDPEPDGTSYSDRARDRLMEAIQTKILPMNEQAAVLWTGTTTRWDGLAHELVRAAHGEPHASWVDDERFSTLHVPALDAAGESFWRERYSNEYLRGIQHTRNYQLNYACRPPRPGGRHWRRDTFRYTTARGADLTLVIDPATTVKDSSDYTAFVVAGSGPHGSVIVEYARAWRLRSTEIRERAQMICRTNPMIRRVLLEANVAADWALDVLQPWDQARPGRRLALAPGVQVETYTSSSSKAGRIARLLDDYESRRVWHTADRDRVVELEDQAQAYPDVEHDDLVDACAAVVDELLRPKVKSA